jgi:hypothetical protein
MCCVLVLCTIGLVSTKKFACGTNQLRTIQNLVIPEFINDSCPLLPITLGWIGPVSLTGN